MTWDPLELDATIGVDIKGDIWSCIAIPDLAEHVGTGRSVRVDARIDDVTLTNVGTLPTGAGGHMVSISAKVRKQLGKDVGDAVHVVLSPSTPPNGT